MAVRSLRTTSDQYLSVSAPAQAAAPTILALAPALRAQVRHRLQRNLAALDLALSKHPHLGRLPVEGGWSALLRRPAVEADEACALRVLEASGLLVHPGSLFDLPGDGHLVLSLLIPEPDFAAGLSALLPLL